MDYKKAGVDIEAGYKSVELMKEHVKKTMRPEVMGGLGGFSGAFSLAKIKEMEEPVLLSGTDGCGTKVKLAMVMDKHDTIGIDAVAMCVNDIACAGGEPLFFLDYIACGKNYPEKIATIVSGVAEGCKQSGCALVGGETAEHPGLMPEDEYDLAGFAVGVCDKKDMITGEDLKAGDVTLHSLWARRHGTKYNGAPYIIQRAGEACYSAEGKAQLKEQVAFYMNNAKIIKEGLKDAGYTVFGGVNAPYIWLQTPDKMPSWDFFDFLLNKANVVGTPGSGFGPSGEGYFRLTAFGSYENTLEAIERIKAL